MNCAKYEIFERERTANGSQGLDNESCEKLMTRIVEECFSDRIESKDYVSLYLLGKTILKLNGDPSLSARRASNSAWMELFGNAASKEERLRHAVRNLEELQSKDVRAFAGEALQRLRDTSADHIESIGWKEKDQKFDYMVHTCQTLLLFIKSPPSISEKLYKSTNDFDKKYRMEIFNSERCNNTERTFAMCYANIMTIAVSLTKSSSRERCRAVCDRVMEGREWSRGGGPHTDWFNRRIIIYKVESGQMDDFDDESGMLSALLVLYFQFANTILRHNN
jgi:hypothetical protein